MFSVWVGGCFLRLWGLCCRVPLNGYESWVQTVPFDASALFNVLYSAGGASFCLVGTVLEISTVQRVYQGILRGRGG